MKKFLIIVSGIYLILIGSLVTLIHVIGSLSLSKEANAQMAQLKSVMSISNIVATLFFLLLIITGVGIILKKNWARFSILTISILTIVTGLFMYLAPFIVPLPEGIKVDHLITIIILGFIFIFFTAIPGFFIIFFNCKSIKESFVSKEDSSAKEGKQFGIKFIAILSLLGGLFFLASLFQNSITKMPLLGLIVLSGGALKIYFLAVALINIYIGIGLLKLQKAAWLTAILFATFGILLGVTNIFIVSEAVLSQMTSSVGLENFSMSLIKYRLYTGFGLVFPILTLIFLILKKKLFSLKNKSQQESQQDSIDNLLQPS